MPRLLAKKYKTLEGAQKRAAFENGLTKDWSYTVVRCRNPDGEPDIFIFDITRANGPLYCYRVSKAKRKKD